MSASVFDPPEGTRDDKDGNPSRADLTEPFFLGDWRIEPANRCARNGSGEVKIDPRNMRVLQILVEHEGKVVSQRELESLAWEGVVVTQDSVYQSIRQLRQALGDTKPPSKAKYIETLPRQGYRLVAEVRSAGRVVERPDGARPDAHKKPHNANTGLSRKYWIVGSIVTAVAVVWLSLQEIPWRTVEQPIQIDPYAIKDVQALRALSLMERNAGRAQESLQYLERSLEMQVSRTGLRNQTVVDVLAEIANTQYWLGNDAIAVATARRARLILDQVAPPSSPERISSLSIFAEIFVGVGEYAEAEEIITITLNLARDQYGIRHALMLKPLANLATLRHAQGDLKEAEFTAREALQVAIGAWGANDFRVAHHGAQLSLILVDLGRFAEAEREARISVAVLQRSRSHGHPYLLSAKHVLAEALVGLGRLAEAQTLLHEEVATLMREGGADWRVGRAASVLAEVYSQEGDFVRSEKSLVLAETKLAQAQGWPAERELRNLHKRRAQLSALRSEHAPNRLFSKSSDTNTDLAK